MLGSNALGAALAAVTLTLLGCAQVEPRRAAGPEFAEGIERRLSPNHDERRPNFVVLHHTSDQTAEQSLRTLTTRERGVSAHYLIGRDGRVYGLVDEKARAWHAGEGAWGSVTDLNSVSIGIELDNNGTEPFPHVQIDALIALLHAVKARHNIPRANVIGHGDIAPGRKVDPSRFFPWRRLAENGFGMWCDAPYPAVPAGTEDALLLQAIGYSTWNFDAAVAAFKRRFAPDDPSPTMSERDRAIAYCLVLQRRVPDGS